MAKTSQRSTRPGSATQKKARAAPARKPKKRAAASTKNRVVKRKASTGKAPVDIRSVERNRLPKALLAILDEHRYVVRLLKILEAEARDLPASRAPDLESIASIVHYIGQQTDRYHHPKEDLIFERMAQSRRGVKATIKSLVEQHKALGVLRDDISQLLAQLQDKALRKDLVQLKNRALEYSALLLEHMQLEERDVFALAYAELEAKDWKAIDRKIAPVNDPVFGPVKSSRYWELFERYVNHTVSISRGVVPVGLVETAASRVEKYFSKGLAFARSRWPLRLCQKSEAVQAQAPGSPLLLDTEHKSLAFERGNPNYQAAAGISWQASATNLLFRGALKPMLGNLSMRGAGLLTTPGGAGFSIPASIDAEPVGSGQFKASWVYPAGYKQSRRTVLYLPGGGFVLPASSMHYRALEYLVRTLDARGMMVNYRLAPEYPFPAGLEDAIAAYRFLLEEEGVPAQEIVIAGDSAGGGLTLSLLLSLREQDLPQPLCACLFSAFTDASFSSPSLKYNRWLDSMLPVGRMHAMQMYFGDTPADHPLISPVKGNYEGVAPILAQVSSTETLLDDTLRAARNARAQDAKFEVEVWQGMPHAFQVFQFLPEAKQALQHAVDFARKQMPDNDKQRAA